MSESSFDPKRRLCPDGSCVGVIGPDGRCSECGRSGDGRPRVVTDAEAAAASFDAGDSGPASEAGDADAPELSADAGASGFDPNRRLCDDGSCVGIIGADGRCGVCGAQAG